MKDLTVFGGALAGLSLNDPYVSEYLLCTLRQALVSVKTS